MERKYNNLNLAGILSVALGLEGESRATFSGSHRESLREALEDAGAETFAELLQALRQSGSNPTTIAAVAKLATRHPERSLQEFAASWGRNENVH